MKFSFCATIAPALVVAVSAVAAEPTQEMKADVRRLLSKDVEGFLAARSRVLGYGADVRPLVEQELARLSPRDDRIAWMRLQTVKLELGKLEEIANLYRVIDHASSRAATLKAEKGRAGKNIEFLVSRRLTESLRVHPEENPYSGLCYFSFPKAAHGYQGAVSVEFGNASYEGDAFLVRMYGGHDNRIKDMGPVEYANVNKAPDRATTAAWTKDPDSQIPPAVVGNTYIIHCREDRGRVDMTAKFRVLQLEPGKWVIIEWEAIPQEK